MQIAEIVIPRLILIIILMCSLGFFIVRFCFYTNKRKVEQKKIFDRELLLISLEVQEQTFQRISEELHDNIGQLLALAKLNLFRWEMEQESENNLINDTINVIEQSIEELRRFAQNLNTDLIQHNGLFQTVEKFIGQLKKNRQFKISLSLKGELTILNSNKELVLFRVIQEAFHNIIKHSKADIISVSFEYSSDELIVTIKDNGVGFDKDEVLKKCHVTGSSGLQNIARRIKYIGATHELISNQNKGTQLCITIPI